MIRRLWLLYRAELTKVVRLKQTYAGFVLVLVGVLAAVSAHPRHRDSISDYTFVSYATTAGLDLLGLVVLLVFSASLMSNELSRGTARLVAVRPVLRSEFVMAKIFLGMTYAVALVLLVAVATWSLAFAFGDLVGVSYGGELGYTGQDMRWAYFEGMALSLLPLWAAVAYAVCLAVFTRGTAAALGSAVGIWILADMVKHRLGVADLLFSSYMETPWQPFLDMTSGFPAHWLPGAWHCAAASLAWFVLFTLLAMWGLHRKDLTA